MKPKDRFLAVIEIILWYVFIYYLLYTIKNPVDLRWSALVLLVVSYLIMLVCPWVRHSSAWKKMWGNGKQQTK